MDFAFFEGLTADEAAAYLARFLEVERGALTEVQAEAARDGVEADCSVLSVAPMFAWLASRVQTVPQSPDPSLPAWIRESESYQDNLFDFVEPSKVLILRGAFYFGEAFVRSYPQLRWDVGRPGTAPEGQPVVAGFRKGVELPVLLVAENLVARGVTGAAVADEASRAVRTWADAVPD
jgi:hypothetical protein